MTITRLHNREELITAALDTVEMNNGYIYADDARKMLDDFYDSVIDLVQRKMEEKYKRLGW